MKKRAPSSREVAAAVNTLKEGGVIVHATETCYGFACDAFNEDALNKLYTLKKMSHEKPISLLVADLKTAQKYGTFTAKARILAKKYWPGPLTIIVKRKKSLPKFINLGAKTVGFRVPGHALSLKLARALKTPMTTTSANISGLPSTYSVSAIRKQLKGATQKPDYILDSGTIKKNPPSTIVDLSTKKMRVIRLGLLAL